MTMTWREKLKVALILAALAFGAILAGFFGDKAHADVVRPPLPPVVDGPSEGATVAAIVITGVFVAFVGGWLAEALRSNKERSIARDVRLTSDEREQFLDIVTEWRNGI